eukprot:tig00000492_g1526.t1
MPVQGAPFLLPRATPAALAAQGSTLHTPGIEQQGVVVLTRDPLPDLRHAARWRASDVRQPALETLAAAEANAMGPLGPNLARGLPSRSDDGVVPGLRLRELPASHIMVSRGAPGTLPDPGPGAARDLTEIPFAPARKWGGAPGVIHDNPPDTLPHHRAEGYGELTAMPRSGRRVVAPRIVPPPTAPTVGGLFAERALEDPYADDYDETDLLARNLYIPDSLPYQGENVRTGGLLPDRTKYAAVAWEALPRNDPETASTGWTPGPPELTRPLRPNPILEVRPRVEATFGYTAGATPSAELHFTAEKSYNSRLYNAAPYEGAW